MDTRGNIYELTDAQRESLLGDGFETKKVDGINYDVLREDVARLHGYLKGRADSDREKRGPGANKDLAA